MGNSYWLSVSDEAGDLPVLTEASVYLWMDSGEARACKYLAVSLCLLVMHSCETVDCTYYRNYAWYVSTPSLTLP